MGVIYGKTGKGLTAQAIHAKSARNKGPFVDVNCTAVPDSLIENELFGFKKGAFSGAVRRHRGKFEEAYDGSIFLDEVIAFNGNSRAFQAFSFVGWRRMAMCPGKGTVHRE